jgi:hypothetical protein
VLVELGACGLGKFVFPSLAPFWISSIIVLLANIVHTITHFTGALLPSWLSLLDGCLDGCASAGAVLLACALFGFPTLFI